MLGHGALEGGQPSGIGRTRFQQPRALAYGPLIGVHAPGVVTIEAVDQAVQETSALRGAVDEQPVHLRRQPDGVDHVRERRRTAGQLAVQLDHAPLGSLLAVGRQARADVDRAEGRRHPGGHAPAAAGAAARHLAQPRAPEAASGTQVGDRFQQVGLAGTVGTAQHHRPGLDLEGKARVAAEIAEHQTAHGERRHSVWALSRACGELLRLTQRQSLRPASA
jgi:hypothetical protein